MFLNPESKKYSQRKLTNILEVWFMADKKLVGEVTHFFTNINVAVIKLKDALKEGENILIEGATTNLEQEAKSMQIEHKGVKAAKKGQSIGLKVRDRVREGDKVYRVEQ